MAKVLVVDDSGMSRRILKRVIEGEGHQVFEASDGLMAFELMELERPKLVFLDLLMPGLTGQDVLKELKRKYPSTTVIVASADIQKASREEVMSLGATAFVNKPFVEEVIKELLSTYLT